MPLSGCGMSELVEERLEALAVLGDVRGVGARPQDPDAGLVQGHREAQRGLAAELDDDPLRLLLLEDVHHVLEGEGLEVEPVGGVVVGRDRLRVAVDHDGLVPLLLEREGGVAAAVVELDALPDPVGAAAEDDDLLAVRGRGLALALVGRVHVRGERLELRRAGVDPLVDGNDAGRLPRGAHLGLAPLRELRETRVREAHPLGLAERLARPSPGPSPSASRTSSTRSPSRGPRSAGAGRGTRGRSPSCGRSRRGPTRGRGRA